MRQGTNQTVLIAGPTSSDFYQSPKPASPRGTAHKTHFGKNFLRFSDNAPMTRVDRHDAGPRTVEVLHKNSMSGNPGKSHDAASNKERKSIMAVIGYNSAAVNAAYYLNQNTNNLNSAIQELASGSRLANPSTDAAGVAVSGDMTARIARLGAATQASQDVVSFAQTTDGFLSTIQQQLSRMSELAQSATNGAFGSADRANYATEFNTLLTQIDSIASNAQFNGSSLFTAGTVSVAIDSSGATDTFTTSTVGNSTSLGINGLTIDTTTAAATAITKLNSAISTLTSRRATVNADISKFNFYVQNQQTESTNLQAANSRIADVDVATESTELAKTNILLQASSSMLAQANSSQSSLLTLLSGH
jgi:flagellin